MDVAKIGANHHPPSALAATAKRANVHTPKTTLQVKQDGDANGVSVRISQEGRALNALLKRKELAVDNTALERGLRALRSVVDWDLIANEIGLTDPSVDAYANTPDAIKMKYDQVLGQAWHPAEDDVSNFTALTSAYMELRKEIEATDSGEELASHLKWLDDSYDKNMQHLAKWRSREINMAARIYEMRAKSLKSWAEYEMRVKALKSWAEHGWDGWYRRHSSTTVEYDKEAFNIAVNTLCRNVSESIKHYGALAKQYALNKGTLITTEEDKSALIAFLMQDTTEDMFSFNDLTMITTAFGPNSQRSYEEKDAFFSALGGGLQGGRLTNDMRQLLSL